MVHVELLEEIVAEGVVEEVGVKVVEECIPEEVEVVQAVRVDRHHHKVEQ